MYRKKYMQIECFIRHISTDVRNVRDNSVLFCFCCISSVNKPRVNLSKYNIMIQKMSVVIDQGIMVQWANSDKKNQSVPNMNLFVTGINRRR